MGTPNRLSKGDVIVGALDVDEGINDTDWVQFNTTPGDANAVARLRWNDTEGTLDLGLKGGNIVHQIGHQEYVLVKHDTNGGLSKAAAVYQHGSDGANITVFPALANTDETSANTLGIMAEATTGGAKGLCCTFGLVTGINTSALTEGAIVWVSPTTAGALTTTKPVAPQHGVQIGFCLRSHAVNGMIFVSVQNGYELEELHNVKITNPQAGQVLKYNAGGYWENVTP